MESVVRPIVAEKKFFATYMGIKVPPGPHIPNSVAAIIKRGAYETPEAIGVQRVVRPGDRVIECGAGIGVVGAIAALHGKPEKIISYEGNPTLIAPINSLYALNRLKTKIEVRNEILLAGPDQPKTISFTMQHNFLGSGIGTTRGRGGRVVEVPTADYEAVRKSFKPTVLIMDIEGAEAAFLKHANLDGIRGIVVEFHPAIYGFDGMRGCKRLLTHAGFQRLDCSTRLVWAMTRDL